MPYFLFFGSDGPNGDEIRGRVRDEHRAHLKTAGDDCRLMAGGPLVEDDGGRMNGTLLVFEAPDQGVVERFVARDPYMREGLFERTEIRRWNWTAGAPKPA
jgi:uncharacterized protein YciI